MIVTNSLTDYLSLLNSFVPRELIAESEWRKFNHIGNILPSALTTFFGFESRLGIPEAHGDFLICADAHEAGRRVLAANSYDIDLPTELLHHPVWMNIRKFSTNWESEASPLYDKITNVWLEFDVGNETKDLPVPSCFFGPKNLYNTPAVDSEHPYKWIWENALPLLLGRSFPKSVENNIVKCFAALPENAYVFQVGLMLAREWDGVRLCIRNISPEKIIDYLKSLDWQGDLNNLQLQLNNISPLVDRIDLDIDVTEGLGDKIGLECYLNKQPQFEKRWSLFLDNLLLKGLCFPKKQQALLTYPGYIQEKMNPSLWPLSLRKISKILGDSYEWVIFKGIHHIKLNYCDAEIKEAKAYLYVSRSLIRG
ncbi:hypothetical protein Riv7116_6269 [Rivularia sp. PCC 7116]|uniref:hypothetical protein n=1 Tax=Rivularia sp. PCC 7116 TaxID=373994 RepID=UPI00029F3EA5|nr:hypothetical protein [Rivularia sp. PCC 7116]AFY58618.1 hypothetical protein Riv7116_6269 [Rivularia sp. PCC 7116]